MKIDLSTICMLASEGRSTLQIPDMYIGNVSLLNFEDYPDDLFCRLSDSLPSKTGFLFLTRKGFKHFEEDLKQAFLTAFNAGVDRTNGVGWPAFVAAAAEHFTKCDKKVASKIKTMENKIQELKQFKS